MPGKIRRAWEEIRRRGLRAEVGAGGGSRRATVPLPRAAGSWLFNDDPPPLRRWLAAP